MVAADRGVDPSRVTLVSSTVDEVAYDLPAITTAGRYWVRGTATADDEPWPFELFVKHVQSWSRSPLFAMVPDELRVTAAASVPWRTEPLAYRSDLAERLPEGLRMARCLGVFDLDELSAAVWLEKVPAHTAVWDAAALRPGGVPHGAVRREPPRRRARGRRRVPVHHPDLPRRPARRPGPPRAARPRRLATPAGRRGVRRRAARATPPRRGRRSGVRRRAAVAAEVRRPRRCLPQQPARRGRVRGLRAHRLRLHDS